MYDPKGMTKKRVLLGRKKRTETGCDPGSECGEGGLAHCVRATTVMCTEGQRVQSKMRVHSVDGLPLGPGRSPSGDVNTVTTKV